MGTMEWFEQLGPVFFLGLTVGVALTIMIAILLLKRRGQKLLSRIANAGARGKRSPD